MKDPCEVSKAGSSGDSEATPGGVEEWALAYVLAMSPSEKLGPESPPTAWEGEFSALEVPGEPGRGAEFRRVDRAEKFPRPGALCAPEPRARALHTFLHHEIQAAELACRALVLFRSSERDFREGLLRIARDEIRHAGLYAAHLLELGFSYGDFPVRDWFWERGVECSTPVQFVSFFGLGLEAANLEHSSRFALAFRRAGDEAAARILQQIEEEEVSHVRFSRTWFERWTGGSFEEWREALPDPLTPALFRGNPLNRRARERAGQREDFLDALAAWTPSGS